MNPFVEIGGLHLSTYALAAVLGYLGCVGLTVRLARREGLEPRKLVDLTFWLLIAVIAGARIGYMIEFLPFYFEMCRDSTGARPPECDDIFRPWRGGFVFYGGFIAGLAALALLVRRYELPLWSTADTLIPGIALAHGLGRIGCLLGGCCYGAETTLPWALRFPANSLAGDVPRHPTQIMEAGVELGLCLFLWWRFGRRPYHGRLLVLYLLLYPAARFLVEIMRGDHQRGYAITIEWPWLMHALGSPPDTPPLLSWPQVISVALIVAGLVLHRFLRRPAGGGADHVGVN